eukprot:gene7477-9188_t
MDSSMMRDPLPHPQSPMLHHNIEKLLKFDMDSMMIDPHSSFKSMPYNEITTISENQCYAHTIDKGIPVVLSNTTKDWSKDIFTIDFLQENYKSLQLINSPRNIENNTDLKGWSLGDFISYLQVSQEERNPKYVYAKDVQCPIEWKNYLSTRLSSSYLFDSNHDLSSNLPNHLRKESIMVHIGSNGTYSPGHMNVVGSNGFNLMVSSDPDSFSYWFIVPREFKSDAIKYWNDHGGDVYTQNKFIDPVVLNKAPFPIYIVKQRVGDLVLIPPDAIYQVLNIGGTSIKVGWNIITLQSLPISFYTSLPEWRNLSNAKGNRIKAMVYYTLKKLFSLININESMNYEEVIDTIVPLIEMLHHILQSESVLIPRPNYPYCSNGETVPFLHPFKPFSSPTLHDKYCDHCHNDIFNRCYHCPICKKSNDTTESGKNYCFDCVSVGIGCEHHFKEMVLIEFTPHGKLKKELESYYQIYKTILQKMGKSQKEVEDFIQNKTIGISEKCGFLTTATIAYHVVYFSSLQHQQQQHQQQQEFNTPVSPLSTLSAVSSLSENLATLKPNSTPNQQPQISTLSSLSSSLSTPSPSTTTKPMDINSKKRPIVLNTEKPKGRPPKNLKEWTNVHKYIISLIEKCRTYNNQIPNLIPTIPLNSTNHPQLVELYLRKMRSFGGVLWAKTNSQPLLPCLWVKDLSVIPPSTKLLPSLLNGKKIVVLFFGGEQDEYVGMVGKKSIFSFEEVNQTLLLKCNENRLTQLEYLFSVTNPEIATKKEIQNFNYKNQIEERDEGLVVKDKPQYQQSYGDDDENSDEEIQHHTAKIQRMI